jgi:hypothetical protein
MATAPVATTSTHPSRTPAGGEPVGNSVLCPQTTVRDYNKFLVHTLEAGEGERRILLEQFDNLATSLHHLGDVRRDLTDKTRELHDSQRVITEQGLALQEEREKVARLVSENYTLMAEQDDARAKIAALLQMRLTEAKLRPDVANCPIMVQLPSNVGGKQPASGSKSCPLGPHTTAPPPVPTLSLRSVVNAVPRNALPPEPSKHSGHTTNTTAATADSSGARTEAAQLDMTAVLQGRGPSSALVATLSAEVKTLKQLIDEQRAAYERDRAQRIADARRVEQDLHSDIKKHAATIDDMSKRLAEAVSQLCIYRHEAQITERRLRGEIEILTARAAEAERLLGVERSRRAVDMQTALDAHQAKTGHVVDHVRVRLAEREEQVRASAERHQRDVQALEAALRKSRDDADRERRIRVRCEQRLAAEEEGRRSDVMLLRQELRKLEKRIFFNTLHADQMWQLDDPGVPSEDLQQDAGCYQHGPDAIEELEETRRAKKDDAETLAARDRAARILADLMDTRALRRAVGTE